MWVRKVPSIVGACAIGAGFIIGGTVITPPSLMRVALADDAENPVAAPEATPVPGVPAPADVAAAALLPGMDPGSLTMNPDGSLVYHGTTPAGVETPGWSTVASSNGLIEMVRGPVAPVPVPAPGARCHCRWSASVADVRALPGGRDGDVAGRDGDVAGRDGVGARDACVVPGRDSVVAGRDDMVAGWAGTGTGTGTGTVLCRSRKARGLRSGQPGPARPTPLPSRRLMTSGERRAQLAGERVSYRAGRRVQSATRRDDAATPRRAIIDRRAASFLPGLPQCPQSDSNRHCADFKSAASANWAMGAVPVRHILSSSTAWPRVGHPAPGVPMRRGCGPGNGRNGAATKFTERDHRPVTPTTEPIQMRHEKLREFVWAN